MVISLFLVLGPTIGTFLVLLLRYFFVFPLNGSYFLKTLKFLIYINYCFPSMQNRTFLFVEYLFEMGLSTRKDSLCVT
jgi:hypothetical protein